ncbi:hypothetical protein ABPG74_015597 [Tetrahymena malaccensis]
MSVFSNSITYSFGGAFSLGKSKRQDLYNQNQTPGPGAYNNENVTINSPRLPQYQISKSPRKPIFEQNGVPPPGAYDLKSDIGNGQGMSISKCKHKQFGEKYDIGPGSYEVTKYFQNKQGSPQYSFSLKYEELKPTLQTPGPGAYDINDQFTEKFNQSKYILKTNQSDTLKAQKSEEYLTPSTQPGPGDYFQESTFLNSKGTTFAKSGRMTMKQDSTPGPGHFNISTTQFSSHKNFTLGQKISVKDKFKSSVPGPGTYDITVNLRKPTIRMGASLRTGLVMSDTPGPGSYLSTNFSRDDTLKEINAKQPQNRGLGFSRRPDLVPNIKTPGPGNYDIPSSLGQSPHAKISANVNKGKWKVQQEVPGPGSYNINQSSIDLSKGAKIKGKHNKIESSINFPGPGSYDVSFLSQSPKFAFTQQKRSKQDIRQLFEPSPGQYEIAGSIGNLPSYLLHKRA